MMLSFEAMSLTKDCEVDSRRARPKAVLGLMGMEVKIGAGFGLLPLMARARPQRQNYSSLRSISVDFTGIPYTVGLVGRDKLSRPSKTDLHPPQ